MLQPSGYMTVSSYDNVKPSKTGATAIRRWGRAVVGREGVHEGVQFNWEGVQFNWVSGSPPILYKLVRGPISIVHTNFQENPLTTLGISRHFKII